MSAQQLPDNRLLHFYSITHCMLNQKKGSATQDSCFFMRALIADGLCAVSKS